MKKFVLTKLYLVMLGLFLFISNSIEAQLFTENFNYTSTGSLAGDSIVKISGTTPGKLGNSVWKGHSGISGTTGLAINPQLQTATSLSYSTAPNIGGSASFVITGLDINATFASRNTGSVYASAIINLSAAQAAGDYFFHLGQTPTRSWDVSSFSARVFARSSGTGFQLALGRVAAPAAGAYGTTVYPFNTPIFIVIKHNFVSGAANDVVSMYVYTSNANPPAIEPTPNFNVTTDTGADPSELSKICIRQGTTTSAPTGLVDYIRVGAAWSDVTFFSLPPAIWENNLWSNTTGPAANIDAVIKSPFTTTAALEAKNLTIDTGGSLVVAAGTNLTVAGAVNNTLTADKFIVESNANLIQTVAATNTGDITVRRNTNIKRLDYTYWSSPVVGQTLANLSPGTLPNRFYSLNNANTFVAVASNTAMTAATGFSVRAPNNFATTPSSFTANFIGKPNNGQQTVSFTSTGAEYILLGNPYPSTVSATSFLASNPGSLHFWTHSVYQGGSANYATFTTLGTAATIAGAIGGLPNGTIQIGQGFMYLPQSGDTFAVFENSMRVGNNDNQFFRSATAPQDKLWLNLTCDQNSFSQILVGYVPNATAWFDPSIDAKQINTDGSVLYSFSENEKLSIQGRPNFTPTDVVQLGFTAAGAGNYKLSIDHLEGDFAANQDIFVKDKHVNATHNLKQSDYVFSSTQGTFDSRFELVYQSPLNNVASVLTENSIIMFAKDNVLSVNSGNSKMSKVQIFDLQGRMIIERDNINSNIAIIDAKFVRNQVVLVKVISSINELVIKKVIF